MNSKIGVKAELSTTKLTMFKGINNRLTTPKTTLNKASTINLITSLTDLICYSSRPTNNFWQTFKY